MRKKKSHSTLVHSFAVHVEEMYTHGLKRQARDKGGLSVVTNYLALLVPLSSRVFKFLSDVQLLCSRLHDTPPDHLRRNKFLWNSG